MASTFLHITIKHIDSKINKGSNLSKGVKSEAKAFVSVLKDLDRQLAVGERQLSRKDRPLISQLRRIAYDAEDVVDTAVAEYSALTTCLGIGDNEARKKLVKQNGLISELKSVIGQDFKGSTSETMPPARGPQSSKGPAAADNDLVIGIDHEIKTVVDLLARKSKDGHEPVDKLAIVGMGGSGKTTLARSIYNHKVINKHFQFQAWVSASQIRDPSLLLLDILTQIRDQKKWFSRFYQPRDDEKPEEDSNRLVSRINDLLYQKSCLLVLDDVWDMQSLHDIIALIQGDDYNSPRYTIVITSRQTPSSDNMRWYIHQPQLLTDEKCHELFSKAASKNPSEPLSDDYHSLAMEMLKKCQGLPLAIVALARLLRTKDTPHEWQRVLSKVTGTDATTMYGPVKEILGLNYDHLPYYLKPCFLYLGLFPEGSDISSGTLIRMWIAEGFIETMNEETLEVAATRYLQELIDHTMVQIVRKKFSGKVKTIRIHNIMRDFCLSRARDLDFLIVSGSRPEGIGKTSRRGVINLSHDHIYPAYDASLRTLALLGELGATRSVPERYRDQANHVNANLPSVCQRYRLLRVLDIFGVNSVDGTVPTEIGNLIHLTCLRIRSTNIRLLPKTIGKLLNLLTLDYRDVHTNSEVQVPNVLWKLSRLRHLYLPKEMSGSIEALRLHTLKDLVILWGVVGGHWMLEEMGRVSCNSLSKFYVHGISNENQLKAVLSCNFVKKNGDLYVLALDWFGFETKSLLDSLALKHSLGKLRLIGKASDRSCSNGHQFPSNLEKLELYHTALQKPETMACLGRLVYLKVLILSKDSYTGSEWICCNKAFLILEELKLMNLQKLEKWEIDEGSFQCLKKLSIISCVQLKRIPVGLVHVRCLEMLHIEQMPSSFVTKLQEVKQWNNKTIEGEDFHIVKHIPKVLTRDSWAS